MEAVTRRCSSRPGRQVTPVVTARRSMSRLFSAAPCDQGKPNEPRYIAYLATDRICVNSRTRLNPWPTKRAWFWTRNASQVR